MNSLSEKDLKGGFIGDYSDGQSPVKSIYFLTLDGGVVYVGQTLDITKRIGGHREKLFDSFSFINVNESDASNVESNYIVKFNPDYNRNLPKNDFYKSVSALKTELKSICDEAIDFELSCANEKSVYDAKSKLMSGGSYILKCDFDEICESFKLKFLN